MNGATHKVLAVAALHECSPHLIQPAWTREAAAACRARRHDEDKDLLCSAEYIFDKAVSAGVLPQSIFPLMHGSTLIMVAALVGFVSGFLGAPLGVSREVHVFLNPLMGLALWTLLIIIYRVVWSGAPKLGWISGILSWRPGRFGDLQIAYLRLTALARPELVARRCSMVLGVAAVTLAVGAIIGWYFVGIAYEIRVVWSSTVFDDMNTRLAILKIALAPGYFIFGEALLNRDVAARLESPGISGSIWLHAYAAVAVFWVVLPRLLLILIDLIAVRKQEVDLAVIKSGMLWMTADNGMEPNQPAAQLPRREPFALSAEEATAINTAVRSMLTKDADASRWWSGRRKRAWIKQHFQGGAAGKLAAQELRVLMDRAATVEETSLLPYEWYLHANSIVPYAEPRAGVVGALRGMFRPKILPAAQSAWEHELEALLSIPHDVGISMRECYRNASRVYAGRGAISFSIRLAIGVLIGALMFSAFASTIAGYLGGAIMGLSGAAAVSWGLAFLGGGALAAGGFGMAGGTAVLVATGAVMGGGIGVVAGRRPVPNVQGAVRLAAMAEAYASVAATIAPARIAEIDKLMAQRFVGVSGATLEAKADQQAQDAELRIFTMCRKRLAALA